MPKFLLDAQLPARLKLLFKEFGYDVIHTLDLPAGNKTSDNELASYSLMEQRIIITKDSDFVESFLLSGKPEKLLLLSCGNISNPALEHLLRSNLVRIASEFEKSSFIELNREDLIVHS